MTRPTRRPLALSGALAAFAALVLLAGCPRGGSRLPAVAKGTNVVLVSVDTLRSDHLPFYGYAGVETPALSALRADSILFEKAYTHVPLTLPAHVSLFTGLLPDGHGVHDNLGYTVDPKVPTLAELLKTAGYATGGAVSSVVLGRVSGVGRGFDLWDDDIVPTRAHQALSRVQRPGDEAEAALERWVGEQKGPFFAFLHLYEPHTPYEPKEPFRSRYASRYDGEIATADAIVGTFLDFLKKQKLYDDALVVFLSDHGEALGEHGESEHGVFLYREVLEVPLLVKLPKGAARVPSVATPVQLIDVFTTIAQAARVPGLVPPAGTVSLLDVAGGVPVPPRRFFAESFFPRIHFGWSELRSLLDGRWHYIDAPRPELYDLATDRAELRNRVDEKPDPLRSMRIELEKLRTAYRAPGAVDEEAKKQLASLGYLSAGAPETGGPLADPKDQIATVQEMKDALAAYTEGRPAEAERLTGRLLATNPRMLDIWELRSLALQKLGRMDEALAALKKTVDLAPAGSTNHLRLVANLCVDLGKLDEAVKTAEVARRLGDPQADEIVARALLARGDLAGAEAAARAYLAGPGNRDRGHLVLARVQLRRNDLAGALAITGQVTQSPHGLPLAGLHLLRGDLLARMDRTAEAEAELRAEVAAYPETYPAWESLVVLLAAEGKAAEARSTAEELIARAPGAEAYLSAIRALSVVGDEAAAKRWQREGTARYPQDPRLRKLPRAA